LQDALSEYYGDKQEGFYWFSRWRFFLLVSSVPFRLFGGNFWGVGHYLFKKPSALQPSTSSLYSID
jgi:cyclopropane-fatty-acyl-phospholipid synthase